MSSGKEYFLARTLTISPGFASDGVFATRTDLMVTFRDAVGIPAPKGIVVLKHLLEFVSIDRLTFFSQRFVKEPFGEGVVF